MNHHLNIFQFYSESQEKAYIENNISRAFSICLTNNPLFLNEYIRAIITKEDFEYLFSSFSSDSQYSIDIQIDTDNIDKESFRKIYAIAMTSNTHLDMSDFFHLPHFKGKKNITDITISIKDIILIIEVKLTNEDCKTQLFNQVLPFINDENTYKVLPKEISWQKVLKIMERVNNIQTLTAKKAIFISDFLQLCKHKFPHWFTPKPFNILSFSSQYHSTKYIGLEKRMRQALSISDYDLLNYSDRLGVSVPFKWAREVIPEFNSLDNNIKDYVIFYIWPGNTKQQGYQIFNKSLDWIGKKKLCVEDNEYELEIYQNMKFCHFNRYVAGLNFTKGTLKKIMHTHQNFYEKSGKWDRTSWQEFENFMDDYSSFEFDWRKYCNWKGNFVNTDRNYFTMSLGFEVALWIPYSHLKSIDQKEEDIEGVANFINEVVKAFETLIS